MAGKHRNTRTRTLALRASGGILVGAALATSMGVAYAQDLNGTAGAARPAGTLAAGLVAAKEIAAPAEKPAQKVVQQPAVQPKAAPVAVQPAAAKPAKAAKPESLPRIHAQDLISLAEKQVGTDSGTKFQRWFMSTPRAAQTVARDGGSVGGYLGAEWCDMFVSWVGNQLGISNTVGEDPWTVAHAHWFQSQHRWGTTPKPGAIVFFSWSGSKSLDDINHVGIVVKDNHNGTIQTVEGNTGGGQVMTKERPTSQVVGYGYPNYAS